MRTGWSVQRWSVVIAEVHCYLPLDLTSSLCLCRWWQPPLQLGLGLELLLLMVGLQRRRRRQEKLLHHGLERYGSMYSCYLMHDQSPMSKLCCPWSLYSSNYVLFGWSHSNDQNMLITFWWSKLMVNIPVIKTYGCMILLAPFTPSDWRSCYGWYRKNFQWLLVGELILSDRKQSGRGKRRRDGRGEWQTALVWQ